MNPYRFAVAALASYRLVRLAQRDTLPPLPAVRHHVEKRLEGRAAQELLYCPWCLGFWTSLVTSGMSQHRIGRAILTPLAMSTVVGFLAGHDSD